MSRALSRARFAVLLLLPAFLGGCYVVPIVPVGRPGYYQRHPGPYYGPYRGYDRGYYYYRGGQAETPAATQASASPEPPAHIEVASISR